MWLWYVLGVVRELWRYSSCLELRQELQKLFHVFWNKSIPWDGSMLLQVFFVDFSRNIVCCVLSESGGCWTQLLPTFQNSSDTTVLAQMSFVVFYNFNKSNTGIWHDRTWHDMTWCTEVTSVNTEYMHLRVEIFCKNAALKTLSLPNRVHIFRISFETFAGHLSTFFSVFLSLAWHELLSHKHCSCCWGVLRDSIILPETPLGSSDTSFPLSSTLQHTGRNLWPATEFLNFVKNDVHTPGKF